jgi:hypothetical protein
MVESNRDSATMTLGLRNEAMVPPRAHRASGVPAYGPGRGRGGSPGQAGGTPARVSPPAPGAHLRGELR